MKKQILLLSLLLSVAASAFAIEAEIGGLWYELWPTAKEAKVIQYKNNNKYSGNIVIPETVEYGRDEYYRVTRIVGDAFRDCSDLTSVTIPSSVTSMGAWAFAGSGLSSIYITDMDAWCRIVYGIVPYTKSYDLYLNGKIVNDLVIPSSVTSLLSDAFFYCGSLTSVMIPGSVTSIGEWAFGHCSDLTSVTIPNSVTSIGGHAFYGCSGLTSVTIGNGVTSIGESTFCTCSGLSSVTIPSSVTSIGAWAFKDCSGLTSVTIGSGVNTIYQKAFAKCPELTDVYCYAEKVPSMKDFRNNPGTDAFEDSNINYATLHVPTASIDAYKAVEPWKSFKTIMGLDETIVETPKCATPTISYDGKMLTVSCETEGLPVAVYSTDGRMCGSATVSNGQATVNTSLTDGEMVIVKIGQKAVKVVMN